MTCRLYTVVQSELLAGEAAPQVVAALRAPARVPGQPRTRLRFLEAAPAARGPRGRDALLRLVRDGET